MTDDDLTRLDDIIQNATNLPPTREFADRLSALVAEVRRLRAAVLATDTYFRACAEKFETDPAADVTARRVMGDDLDALGDRAAELTRAALRGTP